MQKKTNQHISCKKSHNKDFLLCYLPLLFFKDMLGCHEMVFLDNFSFGVLMMGRGKTGSNTVKLGYNSVTYTL